VWVRAAPSEKICAFRAGLLTALREFRVAPGDPAFGKVKVANGNVSFAASAGSQLTGAYNGLRDRAKTTSQLRVDRVVPLRQRVMVLQAK
jgi:hypothetical protein